MAAAWLSLLGQAASGVASLIKLPLRLIWLLLSPFVYLVLLFLSPFYHMILYFISWVQAIGDFIISLEPLYTFLACGATVGVFAGVFLALTSGAITSLLGMNESLTPSKADDYDYDSSAAPTPQSSTPLLRPVKLEDSSSYEGDWHLVGKIPGEHRKRTRGLTATTIHEEESNDSDL